MIKNAHRVLMGAAVFIALALTAGAGRAQVDLEVLVQTGDAAPGTPPGVTFTSVRLAVINAAGEVALRGGLRGPSVSSASSVGIWGPDALGALSLLARSFDHPAPGTPPGVVFTSQFGFPVIDAAGGVAFSGSLFGPGVDFTNNSGIWGPDASGNLSLLARAGDPAPGTPEGTLFNQFGTRPVINAAGQVAFFGFLTGPGVAFPNDRGIWVQNASGNLSLLMRGGDPAPGTGVVFGNIRSNPLINAAGEVAFGASLMGPGVTGLNDRGIWGPDAAGNLSLLARAGDPAPGTGAVFATFFPPAFNAAGEVAFLGRLTAPGLTFPNTEGIWGPDAAGNLSLLARGGEQAPGTPAGTLFKSFSGTPVINAAGDVAFHGFLTGPGLTPANDVGVWGPDASGNLSLLARTGDPAPGTGVVFGPLESNPFGSAFSAAVINAAGEVAFTASLTGTDVTDLNNFGVWGPDASGNLSLLVRKGDMIELSPGGSLPVTSLELFTSSGNEDGRRSGLSDNGQAALITGFPGNNQWAILLSNPNAPPVADAGPDRTVECTSADGASVVLDGSGSFDPDGDPLSYAWSGSFGAAGGKTPTVDLALGAHPITLVVNDGQVDSVPDGVAVTVADRTPPGLVASLTPVGAGDEGGDSDEGRFRIDFAAGDICDPAPAVAAVLAVSGIADIPVANGQVIEFEMEDEGTEVESEGGILEIEAPGLTLEVTASDAAGNSASAAVEPAGLGGDNDDDTLAAADQDD